MSGQRGVFLACLLLVVGLSPLASPQASTPADAGLAPWWPNPLAAPSEFRSSWNLRIPLELTDDRAHRAGAPVQVHMDLARSLIEGGWPHNAKNPVSFMAYPEAVRLVAYTSDWREALGAVPFTLYPTWLEPDQRESQYEKEQKGPFHGQRNAVVTLEWRLPTDLAAGESQRYFVYFDILQNAGEDQRHRKPAAAIGAADIERLDGMYWVGSGTTVYGYYPHDRPRETMLVVATEDNTNVSVYTYNGRTTATLDPRAGATPQFSIATAGMAQGYSFGFNPTHFRIEADKPVNVVTYRFNLAKSADPAANTAEPIAAREGGVLGWTFDVPEVALGVYIIKPPGTSRTDVSISGASAPSTCTLHDVAKTVSYCRVTFQIDSAAQQPASLRTIQVTRGGPVLVQMIPRTGAASLAQVASALGSPVGRDFHASTLSTQDCPNHPGGGASYHVTAWTRPARVNLVDRTLENPLMLQQNLDVEPPMPQQIPGNTLVPNSCQPPSPPRPPGSRPQSPPPPIRDTRPYTIEVGPHGDALSGPILVRAGGLSPLSPVGQITPFGGRHGMEFQVQGPFVVYNFYPSTRLNVTHVGDGLVEERVLGAQGIPLEFNAALSAITLLRADKPISVFPFEAPSNYARFHVGLPGFLVPKILPGQYRGYLFEIRPQDGVDPVFVTALPGSTLDVAFQTRNLARWDGRPLQDRIRFGATVESDNWNDTARIRLSFDSSEATLRDAGPHLNRVNVELPPDVPSDTQLTIRLRAESEGNPQMNQTFSIVILVRQTFGVELWFGDPASVSGPTEASARFADGQERAIPFVVRNKGSGPDDFDLAIGKPEGGWEARITDVTGRPIARAEDVPPGAQYPALLHVRAPLTQDLAGITIPVDAISATSPLASARISLSASLALAQNVELRADSLMKSIRPGATQRFNVTLHNTGDDGLALRLGIDTRLPPGWKVTFAGLGDPSQPPVSLDPGQSAVIPLDLTAPEDAAADRFVSFLLRADGVGEGVTARDALSLAATVERVHDFEIRAPEELVVRPGEAFAFDVSIKNRGNGIDSVAVEPGLMPGGWRLKSPAPVLVSVGDTTILRLELRPPDVEPPGIAEVVFEARSSGPRFPIPLAIRVGEVHRLAWREAESVTTQPGASSNITLVLENTGNVAEKVSLQVTAPWITTIDPATIDMPPATLRRVTVAWNVPLDAVNGDETVRVSARTESGEARTATVPVRVATPRVEIETITSGTQLRGAGRGDTFLAVLVNHGSVPAMNVEVRLLAEADGDPAERVVVDRVSFESIGANGTVVAPLRWTEAHASRPDVVEWGLNTSAGFRSSGNRSVPVAADDETPRAVADLGAAALLVAVGAAAGICRLGRRRA